MSQRWKLNLAWGVLGAAYIWGGFTIRNISMPIAAGLLVIGVCCIIALVADLVTPRRAEDLHIKP